MVNAKQSITLQVLMKGRLVSQPFDLLAAIGLDCVAILQGMQTLAQQQLKAYV